jgi:hypothetical protein
MTLIARKNHAEFAATPLLRARKFKNRRFPPVFEPIFDGLMRHKLFQNKSLLKAGESSGDAGWMILLPEPASLTNPRPHRYAKRCGLV